MMAAESSDCVVTKLLASLTAQTPGENFNLHDIDIHIGDADEDDEDDNNDISLVPEGVSNLELEQVPAIGSVFKIKKKTLTTDKKSQRQCQQLQYNSTTTSPRQARLIPPDYKTRDFSCNDKRHVQHYVGPSQQGQECQLQPTLQKQELPRDQDQEQEQQKEEEEEDEEEEQQEEQDVDEEQEQEQQQQEGDDEEDEQLPTPSGTTRQRHATAHQPTSQAPHYTSHTLRPQFSLNFQQRHHQHFSSATPMDLQPTTSSTSTWTEMDNSFDAGTFSSTPPFRHHHYHHQQQQHQQQQQLLLHQQQEQHQLYALQVHEQQVHDQYLREQLHSEQHQEQQEQQGSHEGVLPILDASHDAVEDFGDLDEMQDVKPFRTTTSTSKSQRKSATKDKIADRKRRKMESNRRAAQKFRIKKKTELHRISSRLLQLKNRNAELEYELQIVQRFTRQKKETQVVGM